MAADRPSSPPRLTTFALPAVRHVPGSGSIPDRATLDAIKALCPPRLVASRWQDVAPFLYGLDLFAAAYFWEAHEVWEPVWLSAQPNSRERYLLAALIAITNAQLKARMRQQKAMQRLLGDARRCVHDAQGDGSSVMGFDCAGLIASLEACLVQWSTPADGGAEVGASPLTHFVLFQSFAGPNPLA